MYDLIIIGAGPAGLTAGLYAGRYRLNTLILERLLPGGSILLTETIENFPGFVGGVSTRDLMGQLEEQVRDLGVQIELAEALGIDCQYKAVKTEEKEYTAKAIIIATGTKPKGLAVPGEEELIGKGVSYCATCDAPFYKDKKVVVVGGGNAAIEEALYLTRYAASVHLSHRRNELRASKILQEKLSEDKKVNLMLSTIITEISGKMRVESVKIKNLKTNKEEDFPCDGIFIYIGNQPNTSFLKNKLAINEEGFIITDNELQASVAGIFACGDCRKKSLYQAITACGDGATAADSAQRYILNK
jgi:thioredoxin reductase (NADPH)